MLTDNSLTASLLSDEMDPRMQDVTEKSTKGDILKAYKSLLKKHEDNVRSQKSTQAQQAANAEIVQHARAYTATSVLQNTEELKREIIHALTSLSEKLLGEEKKLEEVERAIAIQQQKLKELYDLETGAMKFEELVKLQELKKEEFDAEYEKMKRERQREQEEYEYALSQQRKKEELRRQEREEQLKKREEELREKEDELRDLRQKVDAFPQELQKAGDKIKAETGEQVRKEMDARAQLLAREVEGEKKVLVTRIGFLEETITKQNGEIASLKKELDQMSKQVQSIAEKAIEGASGKQTLRAISDIALHQTKSSRSGDE